jgi:hypothetical protein
MVDPTTQRHDWALLAQTIQTRRFFRWQAGMAYYMADGRGPYLVTPQQATQANASGLPGGGYLALDVWGTTGELLGLFAQAVTIRNPDRLPPEQQATFAHVLAAVLSDEVPGRPVADLLNKVWRRWVNQQAKRRVAVPKAEVEKGDPAQFPKD